MNKILKIILKKIIKQMKKIAALFPLFPKKYYCSICGKHVAFFLNTGVRTEIFSRLKIVGGGYRKHVRCPLCGSIDRTRWLNWIIENKTDIYANPDNAILHIAPEKCIEEKIRRKTGIYISGDMQKGRADRVVDITNMTFENGYFDYIIINHVLEHVPDEKKAIEEVKRVLKSSGKFIFSMPICESQMTFESNKELSETERLRTYGQKDHVRLYGTDTKERMEKYGLEVEEFIAKRFLSEKELSRMRILTEDRIFIAKKI